MDQVTIISIFVLLFALLLPGIAHLLRSHPRWFAAAKYTILAVYILANLYETILFRTVQPDYPVKWQLLWSYRESLTFPSGLKSLFTGSVEIANPELLEENFDGSVDVEDLTEAAEEEQERRIQHMVTGIERDGLLDSDSEKARFVRKYFKQAWELAESH